MKNNLLTVLILIIISSPVASAFSHCSAMQTSHAESMSEMMGTDQTVSSMSMMDHRTMSMDTMIDSTDAYDCDVTMDCAGHASAYVTPHAVGTSHTSLLVKLTPLNRQFPQSTSYSPEIKPPCLIV